MYAGYRTVTNFIEDGVGYYRIIVYKRSKKKLKKAFTKKIPVCELDYVSLIYGPEIK